MSTKLVKCQCECLEKFLTATARHSDFLDFLEAEKIISYMDRHNFKETVHTVRYEDIIAKINAAVKDGKIQMFDIEWKILPIESVDITVICMYRSWNLRWPR